MHSDCGCPIELKSPCSLHFPHPKIQDLMHIVEAMQELLLKERQEKLQLEVRLRDEICNEMTTHLQNREQWSRYCCCWSHLYFLGILCDWSLAFYLPILQCHLPFSFFNAYCSDHMDSQKEMLEELYEDKLNNLKVSLTDYYLEEIEVGKRGRRCTGVLWRQGLYHLPQTKKWQFREEMSFKP